MHGHPRNHTIHNSPKPQCVHIFCQIVYRVSLEKLRMQPKKTQSWENVCLACMLTCPVPSPSLSNSARWEDVAAKLSEPQVWLTAGWLDYSVYSSVSSLKSKCAAAYLELTLDPGNRTSVCCGWTRARLFHGEHQRQLIYERGRVSSCSQQVITATCSSCIPFIGLYFGICRLRRYVPEVIDELQWYL